jgi:hypothetical protein
MTLFSWYLTVGGIVGVILALMFLITCVKDTHLYVKIAGPVFCVLCGIAWFPGLIAILVYLVYKYIVEVKSIKK